MYTITISTPVRAITTTGVRRLMMNTDKKFYWEHLAEIIFDNIQDAIFSIRKHSYTVGIYCNVPEKRTRK